MKQSKPKIIVISSPHTDWGFYVPLYFLAPKTHIKVEDFLTRDESPSDHFDMGKDFYFADLKGRKENIALIASGDLSHRLKESGPYGIHPDGAKFDKKLIDSLKIRDYGSIFELNAEFPEAGECGLRSICFILGILAASRIKHVPEIISYEAPFGVGYLVADLIGTNN